MPPPVAPPPMSPPRAALPKAGAEIIVIPEKFYGVALKMKGAEITEAKPVPAPPPPPPQPAKPKLPPPAAPLPKYPILSVVLIVIGILLAVGGGFVYFNRRLLFKKPSPTPPSAPAVITANPPSAPTSLAAAASGQSISLTWLDTSADETGFQIERKEGGGTFLQLTNIPANSLAFLDVSVQPGKTYAYRVLSVNDVGPSAPSNEAEATVATPSPPPSTIPALPPTGLDSDSDGLSDAEEPLFGTDERHPDADRDGFLDGNEVFHLYNPAAKAPVRLADSGLVKSFAAPAGWTISVPSPWTASLDRPDGARATVATGRGERFEVRIEDNAQHLPLLEWYLGRNPGVVSSAVRAITTKGGLEGVASPDRLETYFAWDGKVFVFRYLADGQPFINFRTTYEMMLNSLKLEGAPVVSVTEDATLGPGTLLGESATTSSQP